MTDGRPEEDTSSEMMINGLDDETPGLAGRAGRGAAVLVLRGAIIVALGLLLGAAWWFFSVRRKWVAPGQQAIRELYGQARGWGSRAMRRVASLVDLV